MIKRKCPYCGSEDLREVEVCYYYHEINSWSEENIRFPIDCELDDSIEGSSDFDGLYCAECFNEFAYGLLTIEETDGQETCNGLLET